MKNNNLSVILANLAENARPSTQIDLWPGLKKSLLADNERSGRGKIIMKPNLIFRRAVFSLLALLALLAILLATPQGRTFAQQIFGYFITTDQKWYPAEPTPVVTPIPTYALPAGLVPVESVPAVDKARCGETISPVYSSFPCQLINAESELGFAIKTFPAGLIDLDFRFLFVQQEPRMVIITFQKDQLFYTLAQGHGEFPSSDSKWAKVPADAVQQVTVREYPAEYAAGGLTSLDGRNYAWDANQARYQLRWREGNQWFAISEIRMGETASETAREKLISLAANLVNVSQGADKLAGSDTPTVEQAAGFNIREPATLPDGFMVCSASYYEIVPLPQTSRVEYCNHSDPMASTGFLSFYQMPQAAKYELRWEFVSQIQDSGLSVDEEVRVNGGPGRYLVSQEGNNAALIWEDEEFKYMLTVRWTPDFGGRLGKEALVGIAESMK